MQSLLTDPKVATILTAATACWIFRLFFNSTRAYKDARAVFFVLCLLHRSALIAHLRDLTSRWNLSGSQVISFSVLMLAIQYAWETSGTHEVDLDENDKEKTATFLKPCMIPCRTTHSRLFPTKHSFSYSYLYVGIPVGWKGHAGSILSADGDINKRQVRKTWFSVVSQDYLDRGKHDQGLRGKLQDYLASQGIPHDAFPYAYLVTAPRFLGFSFNPVSFWYLYDSKKALAALILEVNNTFDERRMYFMERNASSDNSEGLSVKFTQQWPKDFHVSPFNDRGGAYSVQSIDPFNSPCDSIYKVDNNIVLKSEDGKPKIIARVFSTEPAVDARKMTKTETSLFVIRWWWVGFMTNPRILKEARALWAKKLQVYYRPEVLRSSIGRNETPDEQTLEVYFRSLLDEIAGITHSSLRYTAAAGLTRGRQIIIRPKGLVEGDTPCQEIEIRILTPAFYSQLVRCRGLLEAFNRHCFQAPDEDAMACCSQPEAFRKALVKVSASMVTCRGLTGDSCIRSNKGPLLGLPALCQSLMTCLRTNKLTLSRAGLSDFDVCALQGPSHLDMEPYHRIAVKLLLADRIAFGWLPILKLEEKIIWSVLVWKAASAISNLLESGLEEARPRVPTLLKLCGIHIWSAILQG